MLTTIIGLVIMVIFLSIAAFAVYSEINKDRNIKVDKEKYKEKSANIRAEFTQQELDEMNKKNDRDSILIEFLSILPF